MQMPTKIHSLRSCGFTLVEAMIVVAILAIIAAIAIPAYEGYIRETRLGAMRMNLDTLRIAVEAFRLDDRDGRYRPASPNPPYSGTTIETVYGWRPDGDSGAYTYAVSNPTSTVYTLSALGGGYWTRCDKTATGFGCCAKPGTTVGTCP